MSRMRLMVCILAISAPLIFTTAAATESEQGATAPAPPSPALKIMVVIPEWHVSHWIPDPAAETAIIGSLVDAGYRVVDQKTAAEVRKNEQTRQRILGDPQAAAEIGLEYGADIIVTGEAFSEDAGRVSGMRSCRARVEIRAVRCQTAEIVAAISTEAGGADIAEDVAAKKALRNAGNKAYGELEPRLAASADRPAQHPIIVTITGIDFDALAELQSLISSLPGVIEVVRPQHLGATGSFEVIAETSGTQLASAMSGMAIAGETLTIEAASDDRISCAVGAPAGAMSLVIGGVTFNQAAQLLSNLETHTGKGNVQLVEFVEGRALYRMTGDGSMVELVGWLTSSAEMGVTLEVKSVEPSAATLEAAGTE